tara:strand:- start:51094 stop:52509 length:1416 start_codon:yes stop_codon:yes gene_type:complete
MSSWACEAIRAATGGRWLIEPDCSSVEFSGVAIDTRAIETGQLFFAFVGEQVDGHAYLEQAKQGGASMCVVSDADKVPDGFGLPVLVVEDMLGAITGLAQAWRAKLKAQVIGVTGSNGKTTTCRLLHSVCAQDGMSVVSQKSFNNQLGVPITILNTPMDAEYLVAELGTSSPGEIEARTALLQPEIAVITSIGRAHLEELGNQAGVAREKSAIVLGLASGGSAVIPGGIDALDAVLASVKGSRRIERLGPDRVRIEAQRDGVTRFAFDGQPFEVPMLGEHNARNSAMAILVGRELGIEDAKIRDGLRSAEGAAMRFERIDISIAGKPIVVYNDAYNANPDSIRAAIGTFAGIIEGKRSVLVLGDMLELGNESEAEHGALVEELLAGHGMFDQVVLVGSALAEACKRLGAGGRFSVIPEHDQCTMRRIADGIGEGDRVLLKGSRGMRLERIVELLAQRISSTEAQSEANPHA